MALGFVYFVFLPSIVTTLAGRTGRGTPGDAPGAVGGLGVAAAGLPLLVLPSLPAVLAGLALVGIGTFFAQATATGFVSRTAAADRGSASGLYLASYFLGGLVGSAVLGQVFDRFGWAACVAGIGAALAARGAASPGASIARPYRHGSEAAFPRASPPPHDRSRHAQHRRTTMLMELSRPAPLAAAKQLAGRVAIVTGSTSGIGLGIARALAEAGAAVVLNGFGNADDDRRDRRRDLRRSTAYGRSIRRPT